MDRGLLLEQLQQALPVEISRVHLPEGNIGLIIVDVVQGFTREGNLSDPESMAPMVEVVDGLARDLDRDLDRRLHTLVLRDRHQPEVPEPPYPPHCIVGTGEELLDPALCWLAWNPRASVLDKDCINGFVGAMVPTDSPGLWRNLLVDWIREHHLSALVLSGDCTDICVSDLTVSLLSARNHGMLTTLSPEQGPAYIQAITSFPIYVYVPGCATFHLDPDGSMPAGAEPLRHPGPLANHVGLWLMASRGAQLVDGFDQ